MAWATPEEVLAMTGETVTEQHVTLASAMIDTYAGVSEDLPENALSPRDRRALQRATIWQAVWVRDKPGLLTAREGHTATSADSVMVQRESHADIMLAPLAQRELRNLSWYSTRTLRGSRLPRPLPSNINFLSEESDDTHPWKSL